MNYIRKIAIIALITLFIGCTKYGKCYVNYSIIYPDTVMTYDSIFTYSWTNSKKYKYNWNPNIPITDSYKGTNYILLGNSGFVYTTCPIRINKYNTISIDLNK